MASRDRRTKAQLLQELEEWKLNAHKALDALRQEKVKWKDLATRQNDLLDDVTEELEYFKSTADTSARERDAFQTELEGVKEELAKVQRELSDRKERDRSPRRLSAATSRSRMEQTCNFTALGHVLAWERDSVIDEQKQTINTLTQEIEALRRGEGPIGEILLHNQSDPSDYRKERLLAERTPVNQVLKKLEKLMDTASELTNWGQVARYRDLSNIPGPTRV